MRQVVVGFVVEGATDRRFLEGVIFRSFEQIILTETNLDVEILPLVAVTKRSGHFVDVVCEYAADAFEKGCMVLCVHVDADAPTDEGVFKGRIYPAFERITQKSADTHCKNLVAVVPVQMTEAWMLADLTILKKQIGLSETIRDDIVGLHNFPENYADPKEVIKSAIRWSHEHGYLHDTALTIADLYGICGQIIPVQALERLPSYQKFLDAARNSLRQLGIL